MTDHERTLERIEACRELYIKYKGKKHEQIERDMRAAGYEDFHRRVMYRRYENGRAASGWIERYGWDVLVKEAPATDCTYSIGSAESHCGEAVPHRHGSTKNSEPAKQATEWRHSLEEHDSEAHGEASLTAVQCGRALRIDPAKEEYDEFKDWLISVSPNMTWTAKHQLYIYKRLRRMTEGDLNRLMIFMPPRHGKSELVTVRYAAWRLKKDPAMKTIIASYGQKLANTFSRGIKRVLAEDYALSEPPASAGGTDVGTNERGSEDDTRMPSSSGSSTSKNAKVDPPAHAGGSDKSPFPFVRQRPKNTESEWETTMGGGLKAVGVGAGVTGFGANLIIIDDPVKNREQANSLTYRDKVWNWWNNDLYTRLEPNGQVVLIQTRWHEDDLAGRLLRQMDEGGERWEVIDLPALAEAAGRITNYELGITNLERDVSEAETVTNYELGITISGSGYELGTKNEDSETSLKGTRKLAQGKAEGRNPGFNVQNDPDPAGVAHAASDVAPLQGAALVDAEVPGVSPRRLHPG